MSTSIECMEEQLQFLQFAELFKMIYVVLYDEKKI